MRECKYSFWTDRCLFVSEKMKNNAPVHRGCQQHRVWKEKDCIHNTISDWDNSRTSRTQGEMTCNPGYSDWVGGKTTHPRHSTAHGTTELRYCDLGWKNEFNAFIENSLSIAVSFMWKDIDRNEKVKQMWLAYLKKYNNKIQKMDWHDN